jgi:SAM-dependent methyltransferase
VRAVLNRRISHIPAQTEQAVATAYNQSGENYVAYADGDPNRLYAFDSRYAYGDRETWNIIDGELRRLKNTGAETIRILDLGCGPGTWLRRAVVRARELGFLAISARGADIAEGQVRRARNLSRDLAASPGVTLRYDLADIRAPLREPDKSVDLCLCLYGVLNHVPKNELSSVLSEIRRVLCGRFVATVRAIGSTPTIYVDGIAAARSFIQDNAEGRMRVELIGGRHISFNSHLFSAAELQDAATRHFQIEDLMGLDLFHGRFASDPRWNPPEADADPNFGRELDRLETAYCRRPDFIDHATHLLLVAKP